MTDTEIIIEHIKVKDLDEFGAKVVGEAVPGQFIPITRQRALAMSKNPYAKPEDTGLLVAYRGDEIVGYFGIMAVMLQHGGKLSRAQWFTTWLVSPKLLGKRVGSRLLESALALGHDFFIVGSQPARRVCRKYGFHDLGPYVFWQIDLGLAGRYNPVTVLLRAARKAGHIAGVKLEINLVNDKAAKFFDR
ncbi:MAG: GNAT family N-acetyltransferase, partial [Anaerolineae bacterium]|nr:GNAT family N-acetyltransferase [Anaerolineae bacterium]